MIYIICFCIFFLIMIFYFRIATHYNIIDKPNERSSHYEITIRGGGVVFLFASAVTWLLYPTHWMVALGSLLIGIISFVDDKITLSNKIRLVVHLFAVSLLFNSLNTFSLYDFHIIISLYVLVIGIINAYNFMDGINGITGIYSLVILSGLQYINCFKNNFIQQDVIWLPIIACLIFLFFNFRKKAKCFAGDVGSITIAFWILFLLLKLIIQTADVSYILFLLVYGMDAGTTILFRLIRKENIFEAHRSHFYQFLANEKHISHLFIATGYGVVQLLVIIALINLTTISTLTLFVGIVMIVIIFISIRFAIEGKDTLLTPKANERF